MAGPQALTDLEIQQKRREEMAAYQLREKERDESVAKHLTAQKICDAAKARGAWIYDPEIKQWYTPEEFFELTGKYYTGHQIFSKVKIKDPVEGLEAGYKQLEKLQERLKVFSRKLFHYYRTK